MNNNSYEARAERTKNFNSTALATKLAGILAMFKVDVTHEQAVKLAEFLKTL